MLSDEQRRRLEIQRDLLQQEWDIRNNRLMRIRQTLAIETDPSNQFKYEQQIQHEENELKRLTDRLDEIEKQLEFLGQKSLNTQNQPEYSDLINLFLRKAEQILLKIINQGQKKQLSNITVIYDKAPKLKSQELENNLDSIEASQRFTLKVDNEKNRQSELTFYAQWVIVNTFICLIIGAIVGSVVGYQNISTEPNYSERIYIIKIFYIFVNYIAIQVQVGGIIGIGQWLVIRQKFLNSERWIVATIIGSIAGSWGEGIAGIFICSLTIGLAQWLVIKMQISKSSLWILASIVGSYAGMAALSVVSISLTSITTPVLDNLKESEPQISYILAMSSYIGILLASFGVSYGMVTGTVMNWLIGITVPKRENCTLRLKALPSKHHSH